MCVRNVCGFAATTRRAEGQLATLSCHSKPSVGSPPETSGDTLCFIKRGEGRMEEIHADEATE